MVGSGEGGFAEPFPLSNVDVERPGVHLEMGGVRKVSLDDGANGGGWRRPVRETNKLRHSETSCGGWKRKVPKGSYLRQREVHGGTGPRDVVTFQRKARLEIACRADRGLGIGIESIASIFQSDLGS